MFLWNMNNPNTILQQIISEPRFDFLSEAKQHFPHAEFFIVGGAVRDAFLGHEVKDVDIVSRGVPMNDLILFLETMGEVNVVGKQFGVIKFTPHKTSHAIDIALPRTEQALGSGKYRDFSVSFDHELPIMDDLSRRDFTINAMAWNVNTREFIDPHNGAGDIARKIIRTVGIPNDRFREDFSRILRALRFACTLGFDIEDETWRSIKQNAECVGEEKVPAEVSARELLRAVRGDGKTAITLFADSGALFVLVPELRTLSSCTQSPEWHSEGDVWTHTLLAIEALHSDAFTRFFPSETPNVVATLGVLFHDIAKPLTRKEEEDGRVTFYNHSDEGARMALRIAERQKFASVGDNPVLPEQLSFLVKMHLFPNQVNLGEVKKTTLAKHFLRDENLGRALLHIAFADAMGSKRSDGAKDISTLEKLCEELKELKHKHEKTLSALLSGEEVMSILGIKEGPKVGKVLEELNEERLSGKITTESEAREWLKKISSS